MREIKFRAFDKVTGEMFDPVGEIDLNQDGVMQFTGLHDKNGKEIYDGDILQRKWRWETDWTKNPENREMIVVEYGVYNCGECGYVYGYDIGDEKAEEYEVIGNIYENPELLK